MDLSLERFKILKQFKSSRNTRVYLVEHADSRKHYIHKTIFFTDKHPSNGEIEVHSRLAHRHIIRLVHSEFGQDKVTMLIEYAKHGDLYNWINRLYVLDDHRILKFYHEVVDAVAYIHRMGFAHRDIKPENVLVAKRFSPRLADFGASTEIAKMGNNFCGTLEYMAPEILHHHQQTEKVDIWALGVLLYEMYHGVSPFRKLNVDEIRRRVEDGAIRFKTDLNPKIRNLIVRMLKIDPEARPTAEDVLADPAFDFLSAPTPSFNDLGSLSTPASLSDLEGIPALPRESSASVSSFGSRDVDSEASLRSVSISQERRAPSPKQDSKQHCSRCTPLSKSKLPPFAMAKDPTHSISQFGPADRAASKPEPSKRPGSQEPVSSTPCKPDFIDLNSESLYSLKNITAFKSKFFGAAHNIFGELELKIEECSSALAEHRNRSTNIDQKAPNETTSPPLELASSRCHRTGHSETETSIGSEADVRVAGASLQ